MKLKLWIVIGIFCIGIVVSGCTQNSKQSVSPNTNKVSHHSKEPKTSTKTTNPKTSNVSTITPKNQFYQLFMVNDTNGWASTGEEVFVKNKDKWVDVTPHQTSKLQNEFVSLYSFNEKLVWTANREKLFKSIDGGKTWSTYPVPKSQADINTDGVYFSFINPTTGWMLVHHGYAAGSSPFDIYQTTNQGASWKLVNHIVGGENDAHNIPVTKDPRSITFIDEKHGFISGAGNDPHEIIFYKTNDEGRTWNQLNVPLPKMGPEDLVGFSAPHFFNKNNSVINVTITGMKKNNTLIYITSDQGNHWKLLSHLDGMCEVTFFNHQIGWANVKHTINDTSSTLLQTTDGGKTWNKVSTLTFTLKNMKFTSAQIGWGINEQTAQIMKSSDGGKTWNE